MLSLLAAAKRLKKLGVLGMNRRNAAYILDYNPRARFPIVDDKLRMHELCAQIGLSTPKIYAAISFHSQLRRLDDTLRDIDDFVVKPNRGSAGRGVLVITGCANSEYVRHNEETLTLEQLRQHLSDVLSGMYSLAGRPDSAIVQQRIQLHPAFRKVAYKGIPDLRVIVYRGQPAMAMLRLPTKASNGRANLHQGGIGVGVDVETGRSNHAVQKNRVVCRHPDTGVALLGLRVPHWHKVLDMSQKVAHAVGLGYLGVDIVVDAVHGPMLLEANARPGLAIQIANGQGLMSRLEEIDRRLKNPQQAVGLSAPATPQRMSA